MTVGELNVEIGAKLTGLERQLNKMEGKIKQSGNKSAKVADKSFGKIAGVIAAAFSIDAIIGFEKKIIEVGAEFQKLAAVLETSLGSESAAQGALLMISDFAAQTPFSVRELSDAFVKLANQGFRATSDQMRKLGDVAASTGKSFDQLAEAIIDAQVGEMERLKEFGIRAQKEGDRVIFTFKGVKTEVANSEQAIRDYILSLGDMEGVSGSMAAISETLGGSISNLGDSFDQLLFTLSQKQGGLTNLIAGLSNALQGLNASIQAGGLLSVDDIFLAESAGETTFKATIDQFDKLVEKLGSSDAALAALRTKAEELYGEMANGETAAERYRIQQLAEAYTRAAAEIEATIENEKKLQEARRGRPQESMINLPTRGIPSVLPTSGGGELGSSDELARRLQEEAESAALLTAQLQEGAMVAEAFGGLLSSSFEAAMINGEGFFETFGRGLKMMIQQLIAAAAASAILSAILGGFGIGSFATNFGSIFGGSSGQGGLGGGVGGVFRLLGTDLVASGNRSEKQQERSGL